jgi:hypothetical protein
MRTTPALPLALLFPLLVACGPAFEAATGGPTPDSGGDSAPALDGGAQDALLPDDGRDAAPEADAGTPETGSDSGTTVDAGVQDTGTPVDSGSTETGGEGGSVVTPYSCPTDAGTVVCSYGCSASGCSCSAPGRFTGSGAGPWHFTDHVTGFNWYLAETAVYGGADAIVKCSGLTGGWHAPTVAEAQGLLAQVQIAYEFGCVPDVDSTLVQITGGTLSNGSPSAFTSDNTGCAYYDYVTFEHGGLACPQSGSFSTALLLCVE